MKDIELSYKNSDELDALVDKVVEFSAANTPATEMTGEEEEFIRIQSRAVLSTLNMSGEHRGSDVVMALGNMAEFAYNDKFRDERPEISGYDRIYRPLNEAIEVWKEETKEKEIDHLKNPF